MKIVGRFYLKYSSDVLMETIYVEEGKEEEARRNIESLKQELEASFKTGRMGSINLGELYIRTSEISAYKFYELE